ncbi:MAG: hypothetical protein M1503_04760 [Thaumarchaeota archaeon]|nr:hypothetical protein [Nitrososphaerota archaeon]MCL5317562.1 hypothetical protein [Nitrososphaerota archaeon]
MQRKAVVSVILMMLILLPTFYPISAAAAEEPEKPHTATAYLPAVIINETSNETVIVRVDVTVTKGSGKINITGAPVDEMFSLTAQASAIISSFIHNYDYWAYDYHVNVIFNRSTTVAGPSGGLALTQAYYAAITGQNLSLSAVSSGLINPDGTIGQVSYIKEKAKGLANYSIFNIPLDQDVERTNITIQKRIGPYPIGASKFEVKKLDLNFGNLKINPSATVDEAFKMSLTPGSNGLTMTLGSPRFNNENLSKVTKQVYNQFLYETLKKSEELKKIVKLLLFRSYALEFEVNSTLETTDAIIALSWMNQKEGNLLASTEILLQAYLRLNYVEYLLGLLLNNFKSDAIVTDVDSVIGSANIAMNETRVASIEAVKTKAYAKMLLTEATNLFNTGSPILEFIHMARRENLLAAAEEGAIKMAQAKTLAKESMLLLTLASQTTGVYEAKDVNDAQVYAKRYVDAVKTVYLYVYEVSIESGVASGFVAQAGYDVWNAEDKINSDPVLAMVYATDAYFYMSSYMALHPGYAEISDLRLPYIQQTAWTMLENDSKLRKAIVPWMYNEFADSLSTNGSKVMSYEKVLSYVILDNIIARDYKAGETYTNYQEWNMAEAGIAEPQPQLLSWTEIIASFIPLVLIGSLLSLSDRPLPLKRFAAFLSRSQSSRGANKHPQ